MLRFDPSSSEVEHQMAKKRPSEPAAVTGDPPEPVTLPILRTPEGIELPPRQSDAGFVRPPLTDQTFVPEVS
jgi:hypothetical protein